MEPQNVLQLFLKEVCNAGMTAERHVYQKKTEDGSQHITVKTEVLYITYMANILDLYSPRTSKVNSNNKIPTRCIDVHF
jgi:hypothetical protein